MYILYLVLSSPNIQIRGRLWRKKEIWSDEPNKKYIDPLSSHKT